jgi:hypothetical protein
MNLLEQIINDNPEIEFLIADGFDDAVIGYDVNTYRLIYSVQKCMDILTQQGMLEIDAIEHLHYNTIGAYVGENTPIWCDTN